MQAWSVVYPAAGGGADRPLLMRRQASGTAVTGGVETPVELDFAANDYLIIPWADLSSPYLHIIAVPAAEDVNRLRLVVLCRADLRVLVNTEVALSAPPAVMSELAAEVPGEGFAVAIGEQRTLVWRNGMDKPQLLDWPAPLRALTAGLDENFRIVGLTADGALWEAVATAPERDAPLATPKPVAGWTAVPGLDQVGGPVALGDAGGSIYLLTRRRGLRFDRAARRSATLYDASVDGLELLTQDRFPSASGARPGLLLLLGSNGTDRYVARVYDLSRARADPTIEIDFSKVFQGGGPAAATIFAQAEDEDFSQVSAVVIFNRAGRASLNQVGLETLYNRQTRQRVPTAVIRHTETKGTEVLPQDVGLIVTTRREQVYSLQPGREFALSIKP